MNTLTPADNVPETTARSTRKWAAVASFLLAVAFIVAPFIYLTGELKSAFGLFTYSLADFLYGPVWAASLVMVVFALRERMGELAPRRMTLALLVAILAAGTMLLVAMIRSANRQYYILHQELTYSTVLIVWTTLVAGVSGAGWHLFGWVLMLTGSAGWASRRLPRPFCILSWVVGMVALFVYLFPELEGFVILFGVVWAVWQGILFWMGARAKTPAPVTY